MKNKLSKAIVIFNLVVTPLVFVPNQIAFDYFYFPKYNVLMISSLLLVIPLWINRQNLHQLLAWDTINKLLVIFMLYLSISVFFAKDIMLAINGSIWRQEGLSTIFFYIMLFLAARSIGEIEEKYFVAMIVTAVIISVYGSAQYFGFDFVQREFFRRPNVPISTIGNQNFIGTYMVLILPLTLNFWIIHKKKIALLAYSVVLFGLLTTMSRGPWLGYAVAMLTYFLLDSNINKRSLLAKQNLVLMVTTVLVILLFALLSDKTLMSRFLSIFTDLDLILRNDEDAYQTGSLRWYIWEKTLVLVREYPWFGIGIENLGNIFPDRFADDMIKTFGYVMSLDKAHNEYLDQMVSSGIPSLIIYLGFLFTVIRSGYHKLKDNPIKIALMASIIGYLAQAFTNIRVVTVAYIFWIFLALLINSPQSTTQKATEK